MHSRCLLVYPQQIAHSLVYQCRRHAAMVQARMAIQAAAETEQGVDFLHVGAIGWGLPVEHQACSDRVVSL